MSEKKSLLFSIAIGVAVGLGFIFFGYQIDCIIVNAIVDALPKEYNQWSQMVFIFSWVLVAFLSLGIISSLAFAAGGAVFMLTKMLLDK